jgi:AcrR family transcriptional regulator
MARRSEHTSEQLKEMILLVAEKLVAEEGLSALTVRRVAINIGYTVGSIYMVFANMSDLVLHVKARTLEHLVEQLQQVKAAETVDQQVRQLAFAYLKFARQNYNCWQTIFNNLDDKPIPAWYQQKLDAMLAPVEKACKPLFPEHSDQQIQYAVKTLWSGLHGVCLAALNGSFGSDGEENARRSAALLVDNFIRGWQQAPYQEDATPPKK